MGGDPITAGIGDGIYENAGRVKACSAVFWHCQFFGRNQAERGKHLSALEAHENVWALLGAGS